MSIPYPDGSGTASPALGGFATTYPQPTIATPTARPEAPPSHRAPRPIPGQPVPVVPEPAITVAQAPTTVPDVVDASGEATSPGDETTTVPADLGPGAEEESGRSQGAESEPAADQPRSFGWSDARDDETQAMPVTPTTTPVPAGGGIPTAPEPEAAPAPQPEAVVPPTAAIPVTPPPAAAYQPQSSESSTEAPPEASYASPQSRAGAHWWGLLLAIALSPVAWFLIQDGSARLYWSTLTNPANVNLAGYLSLGGGLLALAVVLLAARWSSLGPIIAGSASALIGLAFAVFPARSLDVLAEYQERIEGLGGFGVNLYNYLLESGVRGTFLVGAVVLVGAGVVSHGARRQGRREEKARLAVRAAQGINPFA